MDNEITAIKFGNWLLQCTPLLNKKWYYYIEGQVNHVYTTKELFEKFMETKPILSIDPGFYRIKPETCKVCKGRLHSIFEAATRVCSDCDTGELNELTRE